MTLRLLGKDPTSPQGGSPTVWEDTETGELVIQSFRVDEATLAECRETGDVPGHETVIRLPRVMLRFIPTEGGSGGVVDSEGS